MHLKLLVFFTGLEVIIQSTTFNSLFHRDAFLFIDSVIKGCHVVYQAMIPSGIFVSFTDDTIEYKLCEPESGD